MEKYNNYVEMNKMAHGIGEDEIFDYWYQCPKCYCFMITISTNFCPNCGRKIIWFEEIWKNPLKKD